MEHFKNKADFTAIPFDGKYDAARANEELATGQLHFGFSPAVASKVRSGSLRAIALVGAESADTLPGVLPIRKCKDKTADSPSAAVPKGKTKTGASKQGGAPEPVIAVNEPREDEPTGCVRGWNPLESY